MTGGRPILVRLERNPAGQPRALWECRECGAYGIALIEATTKTQFAVCSTFAPDWANAADDGRDHLTNHCPSTYAHRDQPDHQEDQ